MSRMKPIVCPFLRVFDDVFADAFMFSRAANDMIAIACLPGKGDLVLACEFRHADFVPAHDGCQVSRLWPELGCGALLLTK